jgi:hypothetical protein
MEQFLDTILNETLKLQSVNTNNTDEDDGNFAT